MSGMWPDARSGLAERASADDKLSHMRESGPLSQWSGSPSINARSLLCRSVIPSRRCASSSDVGWTSLLLDLHVGVASNEPYDSVPTIDPRIGVTISGRYSAELRTGGHWRRDVHGPGSINIHRTGEQTRYRFPEPKDPAFELALIYYPLELLEAASSHLRRPGQPERTPTFHCVVGRDPAITQMTFALLEAMREGVGDLYAQSVAAWLSVHMITRYGERDQIDDRSAGDIADQRLARTIEFMCSNFAQPLSLERLAAEACISKFHFNRLFTRKVGVSPHRFLASLRLDAARQMLVTTDLSVAEVAAKCGYPAASHFSAAFVRRFGMTPRECRTVAFGRRGESA
jgi:AraC family transcriptional regulator